MPIPQEIEAELEKFRVPEGQPVTEAGKAAQNLVGAGVKSLIQTFQNPVQTLAPVAAGAAIDYLKNKPKTPTYMTPATPNSSKSNGMPNYTPEQNQAGIDFFTGKDLQRTVDATQYQNAQRYGIIGADGKMQVNPAFANSLYAMGEVGDVGKNLYSAVGNIITGILPIEAKDGKVRLADRGMILDALHSVGLTAQAAYKIGSGEIPLNKMFSDEALPPELQNFKNSLDKQSLRNAQDASKTIMGLMGVSGTGQTITHPLLPLAEIAATALTGHPIDTQPIMAYPYALLDRAVSYQLKLKGINPDSETGQTVRQSYSAGAALVTTYASTKNYLTAENSKKIYTFLTTSWKDAIAKLSPKAANQRMVELQKQADELTERMLGIKKNELANAKEKNFTPKEVKLFKEKFEVSKSYDQLSQTFRDLKDNTELKLNQLVGSDPDGAFGDAYLQQLDDVINDAHASMHDAAEVAALEKVRNAELADLKNAGGTFTNLEARTRIIDLNKRLEPLFNARKAGNMKAYDNGIMNGYLALRDGYNQQLSQSFGPEYAALNDIWGSTQTIIHDLSAQDALAARSIPISNTGRLRALAEGVVSLFTGTKKNIPIDSIIPSRAGVINTGMEGQTKQLLQLNTRIENLAPIAEKYNPNDFTGYIFSNLPPEQLNAQVKLNDMEKVLNTQRVKDVISQNLNVKEYDKTFNAVLQKTKDFLNASGQTPSVANVHSAIEWLNTEFDGSDMRYADHVVQAMTDYLGSRIADTAPAAPQVYQQAAQAVKGAVRTDMPTGGDMKMQNPNEPDVFGNNRMTNLKMKNVPIQDVGDDFTQGVNKYERDANMSNTFNNVAEARQFLAQRFAEGDFMGKDKAGQYRVPDADVVDFMNSYKSFLEKVNGKTVDMGIADRGNKPLFSPPESLNKELPDAPDFTPDEVPGIPEDLQVLAKDAKVRNLKEFANLNNLYESAVQDYGYKSLEDFFNRVNTGEVIAPNYHTPPQDMKNLAAEVGQYKQLQDVPDELVAQFEDLNKGHQELVGSDTFIRPYRNFNEFFRKVKDLEISGEDIQRESVLSVPSEESSLLKEGLSQARSADDFVKWYEEKMKGFDPFGSKKVERNLLNLHDTFMAYAQKPEIQKLYDEGKTDVDVLKSLYKSFK